MVNLEYTSSFKVIVLLLYEVFIEHFLYRKYIFFVGCLNFLDLSDENKDYIAKGIIKGTIGLMQSTIARETPQNRANRFTKPHSQSKNAITKDTVQYNLLKGNQRLPARPRDIRKNLKEKERNIDKHELSDILSTSIINNLVSKKKKNFLFLEVDLIQI